MTHSLHIGADAVKASLEKILASQTFARSEKLRSFLGYVVEKEQNGGAQALKGYCIGVDVFGRPEEFDPSSDPLVRVQAGKLRKLLDRYYETEGQDDLVRITIPTGGYVPQYRINRRKCPPPPSLLDRMPPEETEPASVAARPRPHIRTMLYVGATALNLVLAAFNIGHLVIPPPAASAPQPSPSIELPRVVIDVGDASEQAARTVGEAIRQAGGTEPAVEVMSAEDERRSGASADNRLKFRVAVKRSDTAGRIEMSLVHSASGNVIYKTTHLVNDDVSSGRLKAIALDLVSTTLHVSGEIYRFAAQHGLTSDLMQCMSLTELYNNTNARLAFINASACQNRLVPGNGPGSIYSSLRMLRDASRQMHPRSDA
ncbi:hypothetical protein NOF55_21830 [Rhizobiaceae bacterium BDR2-2]|uniref:TolB amino-terminal domain-containing protein n=1 Tax=Ectorhizobium quercum TaxID=2965071 RepID=A0AAE3N4W8_9HYPH|nr:hypothetical protein [Ectorhizobium quercum]MCX8999749.1 hypothetical protein [Ectorhizobium quercum]